MPIPTAIVGTGTGPLVHEVDARWTMAYAASIGDDLPCYLDTTRPEGIVAHPLFAVCVEWPVIVASRSVSLAAGVTEDELRANVHATHDTTIHRLVAPGDRLSTSLETTSVVGVTPGALSVSRLTTVDADGRPVATTTQHGIHLGVPTTGEDLADPDPPPPVPGDERRGTPLEESVDLDAGAAHTYTECARIWNPIHTDRAVALAAGLPDVILHGTATLARGVSAVVRHRASGRPELVRRIACRFSAMVPMPSTLTIRVWPGTDTGDGRRTVAFEVRNHDGAPAVDRGLVVLGEPSGDTSPRG